MRRRNVDALAADGLIERYDAAATCAGLALHVERAVVTDRSVAEHVAARGTLVYHQVVARLGLPGGRARNDLVDAPVAAVGQQDVGAKVDRALARPELRGAALARARAHRRKIIATGLGWGRRHLYGRATRVGTTRRVARLPASAGSGRLTPGRARRTSGRSR